MGPSIDTISDPEAAAVTLERTTCLRVCRDGAAEKRCCLDRGVARETQELPGRNAIVDAVVVKAILIGTLRVDGMELMTAV